MISPMIENPIYEQVEKHFLRFTQHWLGSTVLQARLDSVYNVSLRFGPHILRFFRWSSNTGYVIYSERVGGRILGIFSGPGSGIVTSSDSVVHEMSTRGSDAAIVLIQG